VALRHDLAFIVQVSPLQSFLFQARTIVALSATVQKRNAARQVGLLPKPSG
jgi:hypothetical protein